MTANEQSHMPFALGRVFATPGALAAISDSGETAADFLARHIQRDWGCVSAGDARLNEEALQSGARILSAYDTRQGVRLWIITEAADAAGHRSATTILLPQEY